MNEMSQELRYAKLFFLFMVLISVVITPFIVPIPSGLLWIWISSIALLAILSIYFYFWFNSETDKKKFWGRCELIIVIWSVFEGFIFANVIGKIGYIIPIVVGGSFLITAIITLYIIE